MVAWLGKLRQNREVMKFTFALSELNLEETPLTGRLLREPCTYGRHSRHLGPDDDRKDGDGGTNTGTITRTRPKTKKPSLYRVILLNDDYTPMEFVVYVLERFFSKGHEEAMQIMLHVHQNGVGVCGTFSYEVAESKVTEVLDAARQNQHPLQCTMEKE
jgi:ATP-dependent Clp protease adaptor protein ClpS